LFETLVDIHEGKTLPELTGPRFVRRMRERGLQVPEGKLVKKVLLEEIATEVESMVVYQISNMIHDATYTSYAGFDSCLNIDVDRDLFDELTKPHTENIVSKICNLAEDKEYSLATGKVGHAVYVNFWRNKLDDMIYPRIDNRGAKSSWHEENSKGRSKAKHKTAVYPYVFAGVKRSNLSSDDKYKRFLRNVIAAKRVGGKDVVLRNKEAFKLLYTRINAFFAKRKTQSDLYPAMSTQTVGNCTLKSHSVGLRLRLQRGIGDKDGVALYKTIKKIEKRKTKNKLSQLGLGDDELKEFKK